MTRRKLTIPVAYVLTWLTILALLAVPGSRGAAVAAGTSPNASDARPNVVLMLVDDMRTDEMRFLPQTRRLLGDTGTWFGNAFATNPVCCPARAALLTGQWSHNNGVLSNRGYFGGIDAMDPQDTIAVALQGAGYTTAFHGKYLNGYEDASAEPIPPGWDWWDATGVGTYAFTEFQFANNGDPEYFRDDYVTTRLRARSDATIDRLSQNRRETGSPFFVLDSYVAPHDAKLGSDRLGLGPIPEPKYRHLYRSLVNPAEGKPSFYRPIKDDPVRGPLRGSKKFSPEQLTELARKRAQSLASVDDAVAATVDAVRRAGELNRTTFIFLSDNGFLLGEHRRFGKQVLLEEAISIPLVISGPGFESAVRTRRWAPQEAVAATILDLAEASPSWELDAESLVGASAKDPAPSSALLVQSGSQRADGPTDEPWIWRGVLLGERYRYAGWRSFDSGPELYDMRRDPFQLRNVASDPDYGPVVRQARGALRALRDCRGSCVLELESLAKPRS